jgi:hypothetical protein
MKLEKIELPSLRRTKTVAEGSDSRRPEEPDNKQDTRLNFENLPEPLFSAANGKPSIKSLKQVQNLKSQQDTFRASTGRGSSDGQKEKRNALNANNDNGDMQETRNNLIVKDDEGNEEVGNNIDNIGSGLRNRSNGKIKRRSALGELSPDDHYSRQDMLNMLKKANPKLYDYAIEHQLSIPEVLNCTYDFQEIDPHVQNLLYQFGKKKSLSLDRMMEYAHLLETFNIEPEVVAQLLQKHHGFGDTYTQELAKKFEDIQKKDPNKYLSFALDFITRTCDDGGIKDPSPIHAAHVEIQNDTIAEEKKQKWISFVANGIQLLLIAGGAVWGFYGQFAPTHAPTNAPTYAPTMFPTGSPT